MEKQSGFDLHDVALTAVKDGGSGSCSTEKKPSSAMATAPTSSSFRRESSGERRDREGIGLFLVDADASGVSRRGYPTQDGQRAAEIGFTDVRVAPHDVLGALGRRVAGDRAGGRRDDRRACGGSGRRDVRGADNDGRLSQDAQAVRRRDRLVPGASASRLRHGCRARTGAQHDGIWRRWRRTKRTRASAPRPCRR